MNLLYGIFFFASGFFVHLIVNYKYYIQELERHQNTTDRWMHIQLGNIIIAVGKQTKIETLKNELRVIYRSFKKLNNPYSLRDGSVTDKKSLEAIQEIIIKMIDLLNDYYGNFKMYEKKNNLFSFILFFFCFWTES
ncbi:hypothetical protein [Chryseobacterium salviniae]|uniref:Uncharacterized protein n=1 Tax=Chryseobacterium salviniae TaxID=3101750 RepID=A0ABU6HTB9_9FLAO|nr:hypothetical protein [Chryseobacterium sp. T9W2-O]MEC3875954.1 hypothetical protein [Chryseobacterium sp. T9W2-O]